MSWCTAGAGHGGWCYRRVARLLRADGHEVHAPTLTGPGERSHLLSPEVISQKAAARTLVPRASGLPVDAINEQKTLIAGTRS